MESASLFSLFNDIAIFIRESHKRMSKWEMNQEKHHRQLWPVGQTRWWTKDQALSKVFGSFGDPRGALFTDLHMTLDTTVEDSTQKANCEGQGKWIHGRPFEV